ncbi:hypothetical protein [Nostoc sphaeroides]|uniref:Uncharacterized protein n=1 Tax=Nostoc sphaeroides CCNUC1 TaxID=2653204 RepID=A0A5P8VYF3_9NOSO|nr:hypothetical protein [Nostoc sphaeroides]MCC5629772.1 hypothetical protein [Nostoc sphaeroides CHAB 2801]QFS45455.1 hypothetical protein GXM_02932 [Nostoc sphaeroides CCNUC1]
MTLGTILMPKSSIYAVLLKSLDLTVKDLFQSDDMVQLSLTTRYLSPYFLGIAE